jgi:uncharacterized membrane protein YidH (DUF202 family)
MFVVEAQELKASLAISTVVRDYNFDMAGEREGMSLLAWSKNSLTVIASGRFRFDLKSTLAVTQHASG